MASFDKAIPPGSEGKIAIKIEGKKLPTAFFEKTFTVKTNDPAAAQFNLVVQGNVKRVFEFSRELRWAGFAEEDFKIESIVTNMLTTPVQITSVRWADASKAKGLDQQIGVKLETIQKGMKYRIKVWKKKELPPDNFMADLILTTDHPKLKEKIVKLAISVAHDVELHPETLYFGEMTLPPGATKTFDRTFNIVAARGDSLAVLKVVPSRDDITVKVQEIQAGKSYRATVWVRPSNRIGQYAGSIKIYTNYPNYKELTLNIIGTVRVGDQNVAPPKSAK